MTSNRIDIYILIRYNFKNKKDYVSDYNSYD